MCFDSLCGDICVYTHIWILLIYAFCYFVKNTSFLTIVNKVCVCFSAFVYKLPITHSSKNITPWAIAFAIKMKLERTGKKGKAPQWTFIIPKSRGTASIFDEAGRLYAHPSWASRGLRLRCWQIYLPRQMYFTLPHPSSFSTFPWIYFPFLCILEASTRFTQDTDSCGNLSCCEEMTYVVLMELEGTRVNDMTLMTWKYMKIQ